MNFDENTNDVNPFFNLEHKQCKKGPLDERQNCKKILPMFVSFEESDKYGNDCIRCELTICKKCNDKNSQFSNSICNKYTMNKYLHKMNYLFNIHSCCGSSGNSGSF